MMGCILVALPRTQEDCDGINSGENVNGPVHQNTKIRKEVVGLICVTIQVVSMSTASSRCFSMLLMLCIRCTLHVLMIDNYKWV